MTTLTGSKVLTVPTHSLRLSAIWLPVLILAIGSHWPAHIFMWALALSIYAAAKWITLVDCPGSGSVPVARRWGYLFFWPGMNASRFFARGQAVSAPARKEWFAAAAKTAAGILLLFTIAPRVVAELPGLGAATAMIGLVFMLHFGLFHLLSVAWRQAGVDAPPIMDAPFAATSLSDFWGRRWNRGFVIWHTPTCSGRSPADGEQRGRCSSRFSRRASSTIWSFRYARAAMVCRRFTSAPRRRTVDREIRRGKTCRPWPRCRRPSVLPGGDGGSARTLVSSAVYRADLIAPVGGVGR